MSTHNIQYHDETKKKTTLSICFLKQSEEFRRDFKISLN